MSILLVCIQLHLTPGQRKVMSSYFRSLLDQVDSSTGDTVVDLQLQDMFYQLIQHLDGTSPSSNQSDNSL